MYSITAASSATLKCQLRSTPGETLRSENTEREAVPIASHDKRDAECTVVPTGCAEGQSKCINGGSLDNFTNWTRPHTWEPKFGLNTLPILALA